MSWSAPQDPLLDVQAARGIIPRETLDACGDLGATCKQRDLVDDDPLMCAPSQQGDLSVPLTKRPDARVETVRGRSKQALQPASASHHGAAKQGVSHEQHELY